MKVRAGQKRMVVRGVWAIVGGLIVGGLLTTLAELVLPESAARGFLTTSVTASLGPFYFDAVAVNITLGPLGFSLNVLTLVGVIAVGWAIRWWI